MKRAGTTRLVVLVLAFLACDATFAQVSSAHQTVRPWDVLPELVQGALAALAAPPDDSAVSRFVDASRPVLALAPNEDLQVYILTVLAIVTACLVLVLVVRLVIAILEKVWPSLGHGLAGAVRALSRGGALSSAATLTAFYVSFQTWVNNMRKPPLLSRRLTTPYPTAPNPIAFVVVATHTERLLPSLIESFRRHNANHHILGYGEEWKGFTWRHTLVRDHLATLPPDTIVCLVDGFDSILLSDPDELRDKFVATGARAVFSRERTELPGSHLELTTGLPAYMGFKVFGCNLRYCVNPGQHIGYAADLMALYDELLPLCDDNDDQRCINMNLQVLERHNATVDDTLDLFANYYFGNQVVEGGSGSKRVLVPDNGAEPCVAGFPGASVDGKELVEQLGFQVEEDPSGKYVKEQMKKVVMYCKYIRPELSSLVIFLASVMALLIIPAPPHAPPHPHPHHAL